MIVGRPEDVRCINHEHVELEGFSWCGRVPMPEFRFVNVDHAAESGRQGSRIVACPECVEAIVTALRNGHDPVDPGSDDVDR